MKFKVTVIGLLTTILAVCLFTSYVLIDKTNKQFELQKIALEIQLDEYELNNGVYKIPNDYIEDHYRTNASNWRNEIQKIISKKE